jgi:hypothetical protein
MATCKFCGGSGKCRPCGGTGDGKRVTPHPSRQLQRDGGKVVCPSCFGKTYCSACNGSGKD